MKELKSICEGIFGVNQDNFDEITLQGAAKTFQDSLDGIHNNTGGTQHSTDFDCKIVKQHVFVGYKGMQDVLIIDDTVDTSICKAFNRLVTTCHMKVWLKDFNPKTCFAEFDNTIRGHRFETGGDIETMSDITISRFGTAWLCGPYEGINPTPIKISNVTIDPHFGVCKIVGICTERRYVKELKGITEELTIIAADDKEIDHWANSFVEHRDTVMTCTNKKNFKVDAPKAEAGKNTAAAIRTRKSVVYQHIPYQSKDISLEKFFDLNIKAKSITLHRGNTVIEFAKSFKDLSGWAKSNLTSVIKRHTRFLSESEYHGSAEEVFLRLPKTSDGYYIYVPQ